MCCVEMNKLPVMVRVYFSPMDSGENVYEQGMLDLA